jgi:hypothetical protein
MPPPPLNQDEGKEMAAAGVAWRKRFSKIPQNQEVNVR